MKLPFWLRLWWAGVLDAVSDTRLWFHMLGKDYSEGQCMACLEPFNKHHPGCPIPYMGCAVCDHWMDAHENMAHEFVRQKLPKWFKSIGD